MELLELLAQYKHCNYISDLRFLPQNSLYFPQLRCVKLATYSEQEWIEAVWYLFHRKCKSGKKARQLLIR